MAAMRRLVQRRRALGFSQESLADRVGTDRTTVGRWERGQTQPYPHQRHRLCHALQVTADELDELINGDDGVRFDAGTRAVADAGPSDESDDMNRRRFLHVLSLAGAAVTLPPTTYPGSAVAEPGNLQ